MSKPSFFFKIEGANGPLNYSISIGTSNTKIDAEVLNKYHTQTLIQKYTKMHKRC